MEHNVVACAICRADIVIGVDAPETLVDLPVYDVDGELEYIEIAHAVCVARKGLTTEPPAAIL